METDNANLKDLESLENERFFKIAMEEEFWILLGAILKCPKMDTT